MKLRSIKGTDFLNKRTLVRCGFDVPFDEQGNIVEDERIIECLETLKYILGKGGKLILCGHNGRPKGKVIPKLSMNKVGESLEKHLGKKVVKLNDCVGPMVENAIAKMKSGEVILLENLRFHAEEETDDESFAKQLASLAEIYVNEAFANCHRRHASMTGVPKFLPAYAGFRLQEEVRVLSGALDNPRRPLIAIIGGAKISDKLNVINQFMHLADHVLIGGALANTILKAKGVSVGKSLVEEGMEENVKKLDLTSNQIHLPVDVVTANKIDATAITSIRAVGSVTDNEYILDIGPDTIKLFGLIIKQAKTIVWGGPMGYFELKNFAQGTSQVAKEVADSGAESIVGGGDTIEAIKLAGFKKKMSFVSTGGGAMLEFIEKGTLPALEPLII
ncbi:MAG: phosphoglycerate kinase [Patescibacteria group bacterium]|jgi:phosphoglycerate kinase